MQSLVNKQFENVIDRISQTFIHFEITFTIKRDNFLLGVSFVTTLSALLGTAGVSSGLIIME
jgi:hypothetical protein